VDEIFDDDKLAAERSCERSWVSRCAVRALAERLWTGHVCWGAVQSACAGTLTADMQGMPCGERAAPFG
ncbi:MAG: hypothetical protein ACKPJJ_06380, partial [Planctomycetaceae bacterium]